MRAVVKQMREPSEAMLKDVLAEACLRWCGLPPAKLHQATIDDVKDDILAFLPIILIAYVKEAGIDE